MSKMIYPDAASFLITENCNLSCKYCFENHNDKVMSNEVLMKGLSYLSQSVKKSVNNRFHAMIFGGEPTLYPDLIEKCFQYGLDIGKRDNTKFTASIVTNSTIMNDKLELLYRRYAHKVGLNVQLSVDGDKESQNENRLTKSGQPSFELVEKVIPMYKKIFTDLNMLQSLSIHGCLTRKTLPRLFDNFKYFKEVIGLDNIWFMPIHEDDWEDSDIDSYKIQLNQIADYILEEAKAQHDLSPIKQCSPINRCLSPSEFPSTPCGAGRGFITFTADGDIFPCHHFYFIDRSLKIGDVWNGIDEPKRKIYTDYSNEDIDCDKNCDHHHCYRCIAVNYGVNGSITSQVKGNYCKMSYIEKGIQDRIKLELEKLGLIDKIRQGNSILSDSEYVQEGSKFIRSYNKDGKYFEEFKNTDGSLTILDMESPHPRLSDQLDCNNLSLEESLEVIGGALKLIIEDLSKIKTHLKID